MQITIQEVEEGNLVYIKFLSPRPLEPPVAEKVPGVTCLLLFDADQQWLGLRLLPVSLDGQPLLLPAALSCDFPLYMAFLRQNPDFIEVTFAKGTRPAAFLELGCSLHVLEGELFAIELSLPKGKVRAGQKFLEPFLFCSETNLRKD